MKLIIGLGNPGKTYEQTWHNLGFLAVKKFQLLPEYDFGNFRSQKKFLAQISESQAGEDKIILALPQTFMNLSGQTAGSLAKFYRLSPNDIIVVNDDIDLPLSKIRISVNATAGGHKGVQSIIDHLGSKNFTRFRIGMKPSNSLVPTEKFVLQKIDKSSKLLVEQSLDQTCQAIKTYLDQGLAAAMNRFN